MQSIFLVHPIAKRQNRIGMQTISVLMGSVCMTIFLAHVYAGRSEFAGRREFATKDSSTLIVKSDLLSQRGRQVKPTHAVAYVLSMDNTSARALHTERVLGSVGFQVAFVTPTVPGNRILDEAWSYKLAFLHILQAFVRTNDAAWVYLFQDDIRVHKETTWRAIQAVQAKSDRFMYLGICGTFEQFVVQWWTLGNQAKCGRCAHAMAFSRKGAQEFIAFNYNLHDMYAHVRLFDVVVEAWCLSHNGFPVLNFDLTSPYDRKQRGAFFQDKPLLLTSTRNS